MKPVESKSHLIRVLSLSATSCLLAVMSFIFAAPALKVMRSVSGRGAYWFTNLFAAAAFLSLGFPSAALSVFSVSVLMGVFAELEAKTTDRFVAIIASVLTTGVISWGLASAYFQLKGLVLYSEIKEQMIKLTQAAVGMNANLKIDAEVLMSQLPSGIAIILLFALATGFVFERQFANLFRVPFNQLIARTRLVSFKNPDYFIWVAMTAFLFSFLELGNKALMTTATNLINVMMVFYFFQGLAVIESFMTALKVGPFLKGITYVAITLQMFFVVSAIGIIDFWVDFRGRFIRRKSSKAAQ